MKYLRWILLGALVLVLVAVSSFFYWVYANHVTPILMYHHVVPSGHDEADKVSPENFRHQIALIKKFGYNVLGLDEYTQKRLSGDPLARQSLVITFDDGYENNYLHAFPVLKEFGYPAAIFVHVEKIGTPGYLTWDQIKEMRRHKITIGSHTMSHPHMPSLTEEDQRRELVESKRILEKELGAAVDFLAYPAGAFSDLTKALAQQTGYKVALTTNRGFAPKNSDLFELKRVRMSNSDVKELYVWVKYAGYSNVFRKGKKPH